MFDQTPKFEQFDLDACTDCVHILANGECGDEDEGLARANRTAERHGTDVRHMSVACSDDHEACEGWHIFTCEVCGDDTEGEKHFAVILRPID